MREKLYLKQEENSLVQQAKDLIDNAVSTIKQMQHHANSKDELDQIAWYTFGLLSKTIFELQKNCLLSRFDDIDIAQYWAAEDMKTQYDKLHAHKHQLRAIEERLEKLES